jgi:hypothetical protein
MHKVSIPREADAEGPRCGGSDRLGKYEQPTTAKAIRMTLARTISPSPLKNGSEVWEWRFKPQGFAPEFLVVVLSWLV